MAYSSKEIKEAVSTVHMNSRRQAKRNLVTDYTGPDIYFIGDCCFAYSGTFVADSASHIALNFNSGPNFIKANIKVNGAFNPLTSSVANTNGQIKLNGIMVGGGPMPTALDSPYFYFEKLIIPPFTQVQVLINFHETDANDVATAVMTGTVYSGAEIVQGAI